MNGFTNWQKVTRHRGQLKMRPPLSVNGYSRIAWASDQVWNHKWLASLRCPQRFHLA